MSKTTTDQDLLLTCIQDLHAGCTAFAERYPSVAQQAQGDELRTELIELYAQAAQRAERLKLTEAADAGPENLWMSGVLDDAIRDTQTIARGRHLDIALIGGVRKALVAERVSHETAMVLARGLEQEDVTAALEQNLAELCCLDDALAARLMATAKSAELS